MCRKRLRYFPQRREGRDHACSADRLMPIETSAAPSCFVAPNWSVPAGGMTIGLFGRRARSSVVAALLGDHDILAEQGETLQSVWARWAFDLWGLIDGQADVDDNCKQTRRWFIETACAL